ncbi:MAG: chemotaxis-specific protein-glutamate methyltransferase CheB [Gammaproteobacteria bacterium]|nr:chemotaxis-specific protein-glutamate methyltransferase CheB [Gammaproteobacteria bacterium]
MKIAIVNDVASIRHLLKMIISENSNHSIIWSAEDGNIAVEKAADNTPDMILMDLIMPNMGGTEATQIIMKNSPCAILIVTADVNESADKVFKAMSYGALDAISTPNLNPLNKNSDIDGFLNKLLIVERLVTSTKRLQGTETSRPRPTITTDNTLPLVCIGSSTGGPGALATLFSNIPKNTEATFIVVQHVDKNFTAGLCDWLDQQTELDVQLAEAGIKPEKGHVYIAGGDEHLSIDNKGLLALDMNPREYIYRPSIDIFFDSISHNWTAPVIGALLTGMGYDGAKGLLSLLNTGAYTIAQDEDSCAVFGMPRAAIKLNAAENILPIDQIADNILQHLDTIKLERSFQAG